MTTINLLLSLAALIGGLLVARAFLPHIRVRGQSPAAYLARGFFIASAVYFPRTAYWDIIWVMQGGELSSAWINVLVNAGIILAEYFALRARWAAIPEEDRGRWNIINAAWYPSGLNLPRLRCGG